jgi:hypothetical protein
MTTLRVTLSNERLLRLKETADRLGLSTNDLLLIGIDEFLRKPDDDLKKAVERVLDKNRDLYRKLDR